MKNIIGKNIKALRKQYQITQSELAKAMFGSKSPISNWENGYALPDIYTLIKIADYFDVSLDELVGRE